MSEERFTPAAERDARLMALPGAARVIGESEQGRPIVGVVLGDGPIKVSLVAGAHADEPVGAETLLQLAEQWSEAPPEDVTAVIVPHVNPDGEARNRGFRGWMDRWPDYGAYEAKRVRELPGWDVEYGYPSMRVENAAVSRFLAEQGPYDLHLSLHGMSAAPGMWMLIHEAWIERTAELRRKWSEAVHAAGYGLLDWDRGGEKGFKYIGPGFATTPSGKAMRAYFRAKGDEETAGKFQDSSMEFVRSLPGSEDGLCIVTEIPLWVDEGGKKNAVPLSTAVRLQRLAIALGIDAVRGE